MPQAAALPPTDDFEAVLDAVTETARGRWFIAEFARRHRAADTERVLAELGRMQTSMSDLRINVLQQEMKELSQAIIRTRSEISQIKPDTQGNSCHILSATGELDAIVTATESATTTILNAAEEIQNSSVALRAQGIDRVQCDALDNAANTILMACSFQDATGQRTTKVVNTLRYLEQRVNAMVEILESHAPAAPRAETPEGSAPAPEPAALAGSPRAGEGVTQTQVDEYLKTGALPDLEDLVIAETTPAAAHGEILNGAG